MYIRPFPYIQGSFRCIWDSRGLAALAQTPIYAECKEWSLLIALGCAECFSVGLSQKYFRISALLALNCSSTCFVQVYPIISWSFWWASIRVVAFDTWSWWRCCWKSGFLFEILGSCQWSSKRRCRYPIQIQSKSCGSYVGICCEVQRWQFWAYRSSCRSGLQADIGTSSQLWQ